MSRNFVVLAASTLIVASAAADKPSLSFWKAVDTTIADRAVASAAVGDLNHDNIPDLVASSPAAGTVTVALGLGTGGFAAPATYAVSTGTGDLALADLDHDGDMDIVVAAQGIAALLGNGDGTFGAPVFSPGSAASAVASDFDHDGFTDIASIGRNGTSVVAHSVDIYRGLGNGSFDAPHTIYLSDNGVRALAAGDFNNDGWPDLAIPETDARTVHVYLNAGALTFTRASSTFIEVGPSRTATGDVDGNGTLDLVTANFLNSVSVLLGNGDGTLQPPRTYAVGPDCTTPPCASVTSVALADLDLDGLPDVLAATDSPGSGALLPNLGGGSFAVPFVLETSAHAMAVAAADTDQDGSTDVVLLTSDAATPDAGPRIASVFRNKARPHANGQGRSARSATTGK
jgi:hypothetical protein